jgi:hypothetical protein
LQLTCQAIATAAAAAGQFPASLTKQVLLLLLQAFHP